MSSRSLVYVFLLIGRIWALPIGGAVDSSYDAWATALSDVGPLILLIGERSTKQLLRDVRGVSEAFSLAAAPLGLVSIVTSLLRVSGSHRLRSFLGFEQESRSVAALEMSRVNCNGIHTELVDGYLVRTTAATSTLHAGAAGVSALQCDLTVEAVRDIVTQLLSCHAYEAQKVRLKVPSTDAKLRWCSQVLMSNLQNGMDDQLLELIAAALQVNLLDPKADGLRSQIKHALHLPSNHVFSPNSKKVESVNTISFTFTFDAISEYCTANMTSRKFSILIGIMSMLTIVALYVIELHFSLGWKLSTGWLLTTLGYLGIVTFVTLAALHIQRACHSIPLRPKNAHLSQQWRDGLVIATQSDSKQGADFLTAVDDDRQSFEAIWLSPLTRLACIKADAIGVSLTLSFLCHYLGLRSSSWWLGICELAICISAAFARSLTKSMPTKFGQDPNNTAHSKLEWRCYSTGLIKVQNVSEVDGKSPSHPRRLDLRIYSTDNSVSSPAVAETIAWHTASLALKDQAVLSWILEKTGMRLWSSPEGQQGGCRAMVVSFNGGLLASEGLVSNDAIMCVAFSCQTANLIAPTAWLARAIMRQPRWMVDRGALCSITDTIGKVHIPALSSIMSWWTVSELRNGPSDNQENLQWAFLLLNSAFFALLQSASSLDQDLVTSFAGLHKGTNPNSESAAQAFFKRIKSEQVTSSICSSKDLL